MAQINKPSDYFNTKLYTGNGSYGHSITGVGFQPDFVWIKSRSNADNHNVFDAVRGTDKGIRTNTTAVEFTSVNLLHSFDSDGFTVDDHTPINRNGGTHVAWNWLANGSGSSNTDGSITSTVSVNTTAGFSIVKYTGTYAVATVGHGLGVTPKMIIAKGLGVTNNWLVYHPTTGNTKALALQDTTSFTGSHLWNNTSPTSSVFSLGQVGATNTSGQENIAYCFAEIKGYSKISSYTGNGSTDGTFVYTGFKPAFILIRRTDTGDNWLIHDNRREGFNPENDEIMPNLSNVEQAYDTLDILSNGFKLRHSAGRSNNSGGTYIYMAIAEQPLVGTNNIPCTAR
jgi:hypothetical protein